MKEIKKADFAKAELLRPRSLRAFGAALRRRREALGFTLDELMAKTGISKPYLSNIETGSAPGPASEEKLRRIAGALRIPAADVVAGGDWLRTPASVRRMIEGAGSELPRRADGAIDLDAVVGGGDRSGDPGGDPVGDPVDDPSRDRKAAVVADAAQGSLPHGRGSDGRGSDGRGADGRGSDGHEAAGIPLRAVPLINRVAAGRAAEYTDLDYPAGVADQYVPMPDLPGASVASAFALRVTGDSMLPEYREGEIVVVGPAGDEAPAQGIRGPVKDGEDCVVRLGERENFATTFKRVFWVRDEAGAATGVRLAALNPKYADRVVKLEDVSGIYPLLYRVVPARRG